MTENKIAKYLKKFKEAVENHDDFCPYEAYGIGMAADDIERIGFEEGETLWGHITIQDDGRDPGENWGVLCSGEHDADPELEAQETLRMIFIGIVPRENVEG